MEILVVVSLLRKLAMTRLQRKARPEGTRPNINDRLMDALLFANLSSLRIPELRGVLPL